MTASDKSGITLSTLSFAEAVALFKKERIVYKDPFASSTVKIVQDVIVNIQQRGDEALFDYTQQFDSVQLDSSSIRVTPQEIATASNSLSDELKNSITIAYERVEAYHKHQVQDSWYYFDNQSMLGQHITPLSSVGLYIPGGKAAYPSTVLMGAVPARLAGVERIVLCSPPNKDGSLPAEVLFAASLCGVDEIYKVGGAQAVAALALGTESISPVDKICGPGNKYVAEAKRLLFGTVDIDMIAGPSEILVYADQKSDPEIVIRDLFSQAEHDEDAPVVLVSDSEELINSVNHLLPTLLADLPRNEIISSAIKDNGLAVLVNSPAEAYQIINLYAPEHLEILAERDTNEILSNVKHAGAIFIGAYSPEPMGDYLAGPNHTLPTAGTARFSSPLGVYDFVKKSSVIALHRDDFMRLADDAAAFADAEGLHAHAESVRVRKKH